MFKFQQKYSLQMSKNVSDKTSSYLSTLCTHMKLTVAMRIALENENNYKNMTNGAQRVQ